MSEVPKTKVFLLALIIIIGLIFLNFPNISNEVKNFFYSISKPVERQINHLLRQTKNSWDFLNSLKTISKDNIALEEKVKKLSAQNVELKELEKENEFLRSYLNLPSRTNYQIDLANIIGRDFQGLEEYALIDKGGLDGIKSDMPVVVFNNILVGKVIEVFDDFSKILLITSTNSKIPSLIQESRIEGLVRGTKENFLLMDLVPKAAKIEQNQTIVTSGIDKSFPRGLSIGKILSVESLENEMFLKIWVEPAIDIGKLERVFIIKNK